MMKNTFVVVIVLVLLSSLSFLFLMKKYDESRIYLYLRKSQ